MATVPVSQSYSGVLVASADAGLREKIVATLNTNRWPVMAAHGGADALGKLESSDCDVLLLDRRLPDLDADELIATVRDQCSVHEAEEKLLGLSHCDGGRILADKWHLAACIVDTIKYHHRFSQLSDYLPLVALVNISDRLCRIHGLGYGFRESIKINWLQDEAIEIVSQAWPIAKTINWQSLSGELDSYLKDVQKLVSVLYRFSQ